VKGETFIDLKEGFFSSSMFASCPKSSKLKRIRLISSLKGTENFTHKTLLCQTRNFSFYEFNENRKHTNSLRRPVEKNRIKIITDLTSFTPSPRLFLRNLMKPFPSSGQDYFGLSQKQVNDFDQGKTYYKFRYLNSHQIHTKSQPSYSSSSSTSSSLSSLEEKKKGEDNIESEEKMNNFQENVNNNDTLDKNIFNKETATPQEKRRNAKLSTNNLVLYKELSKARLSALVVMTTSAGFLSAGSFAFNSPDFLSSFISVSMGTALAAGAANTFNQVIEVNNDKLMKRTFTRPLPAGRISKAHALAWGTFATCSSGVILYGGTTPLTTALGLGNIALYALPYTLSKTRSEINTWVGAIVGAIPPVMGYTAATQCGVEGLYSPETLTLGSLLFLWQFPHFFSLAWVHRKDYARGGFQMVPVNDPNGTRTAELIWNYSLYLLPVPILAAVCDVTSSMFAIEGTILTGYLLKLAHDFKQDRSDEKARKIFFCSLWYLPLLLILLVYHSKSWLSAEETESLKAVAKEKGMDENFNLQNVADIGEAIEAARRFLTGFCIHEIATSPTNKLMCPKVQVEEKAIETIDEIADGVDQIKSTVKEEIPQRKS